jgi:hypothetical protein
MPVTYERPSAHLSFVEVSPFGGSVLFVLTGPTTGYVHPTTSDEFFYINRVGYRLQTLGFVKQTPEKAEVSGRPIWFDPQYGYSALRRTDGGPTSRNAEHKFRDWMFETALRLLNENAEDAANGAAVENLSRALRAVADLREKLAKAEQFAEELKRVVTGASTACGRTPDAFGRGAPCVRESGHGGHCESDPGAKAR